MLERMVSSQSALLEMLKGHVIKALEQRRLAPHSTLPALLPFPPRSHLELEEGNKELGRCLMRVNSSPHFYL